MTGALTDKPREKIAAAEPTREAPVFTPRFDIVETDQELTLYGDLPGVKEGRLDIRFENDQLIIHGKVEPRHEGVTLLRQEYGIGDFHRTFSIGEVIDASKIAAEIRNGELTIHLPKTEEAKPRRITVTSR